MNLRPQFSQNNEIFSFYITYEAIISPIFLHIESSKKKKNK